MRRSTLSILVLVGVMVMVVAANAESYSSTSDGSWTDAIWSPGGTPTGGDYVDVYHNVVYDAGASGSLDTLNTYSGVFT